MFCCFPLSRKSVTPTPNEGKKPLVTSEPTKIRYQTILTIPYAHVLRDDKIEIESSDVVDTKTPSAYFLFNGTISHQDYEKVCFPVDNADISTPVVLATRTTSGHILFEPLFQINHVNAADPSASIRMHPLSSNTVSMARPFDEFSTSNPPDVQSDDNTTKSD